MVSGVAKSPVLERAAHILHNRPNTACVISPAKLNLGLRIVGRRQDGYHLIESLFWPLDFTDEMELIPSDKLAVTAVWDEKAPRPSPEPPQQRENLVFRAAERAMSERDRIEIRIRKRIPIGAGLGGGSSNAGSLLRHLAAAGRISDVQAEETALALGADVPFFLGNQPAWVEGIGERRTVLEIEDSIRENLTFLLIVPPSSTPTPIIFSQYRGLGVPFAKPHGLPVQGKVDWGQLKNYLGRAENSLQGVAAMEYPLVKDILSRLRRLPSLYSGLSGTGSTCFAVLPSPQQASDIAQELQLFCRKNGCQSILARTHSLLGEHHGNHRGQSLPS